jgi:DNA helicase IV
MLRNARVFVTGRFVASPDWLEGIRSRYLTQVFVDEATDFSAVQLACTMELAHPRLRSWFACGDLLQRITAHGVQDLSQIEWIARGGSAVDIREVRIGYRQARRLRELSAALAGRQERGVEAPEGEEDADIWPLLAEHHTEDRLGAWLGDRILEVEHAVGRVPSIAVFVDGDDRIDDLVAATRPSLEKRNVPIVGCKGGRLVGDAREVRVFDIRHIKGLEFEAVFFAGIDRLAERLPDLFDRYLYVGITRAATYLGVTCEASLPTRLDFVRPRFGDATSHRW